MQCLSLLYVFESPEKKTVVYINIFASVGQIMFVKISLPFLKKFDPAKFEFAAQLELPKNESYVVKLCIIK